MDIQALQTAEMIVMAFDAFVELRPYLTDADRFTQQVLHQQQEGYRLFAILEGEEVVSCVGLRILTTLAWGKIVYIDDLITKSSHRGKGYGHALLDYAIKYAHEHGCAQVHLDSGYTRNTAHRVYLNHGFDIAGHHFSRKLI
ncbi:MAG: GNAT family N-acetyltransferase [Phototrophicaceae bacterium]